MPKIKKDKKPPAPVDYTKENLECAVLDVTSKKKTYREAEECYGVPISTIYNRIKGRKNSVALLSRGRKPTFSKEEETELFHCIVALARIGHPCNKEEVKNIIQKYVVTCGIVTPFTDNRPGEDWYKSFMRRHDRLSLKKAQPFPKVRMDARDPIVVYDFYDQLGECLQDPQFPSSHGEEFVFNCDESGFNTDPTKVRAIGEKGKPLHRVIGGSGRDSITVLGCVSAAGARLPPLIVHTGKTTPQPSWMSENDYPGTKYVVSVNGWMEETIFYNWFSLKFVQFVDETRAKFELPSSAKAVLIFDGHKSHISLRICICARRNNIELVKFPSHLTDIMQPLDKTVFSALKNKWDSLLVDHGRENMGLGSLRLTKDKFSELLGIAWREALSPENISKGFHSIGLYPFDKTKFPEFVFDSKKLQQYKKQQVLKKAPLPRSKVNSPGIFNIYNSTPEVDRTLQCSFGGHSPINLSTRTPVKENEHALKSITNIFSSILQNGKRSQMENGTTKKMNRRLKFDHYGEVLTRDEAIERLEKEEAAKKEKEESLAERKRIREYNKQEKLKKAAETAKKKLASKKRVGPKGIQKSRKKSRYQISPDSSDLEDEDLHDVTTPQMETNEEPAIFGEGEEIYREGDFVEEPAISEPAISGEGEEIYREGDFIVGKIVYNFGTRKECEKLFLGKIESCAEGRLKEGFKVNFLRKARTLTLDGDPQYYFIYPALIDIYVLYPSQIVQKISPPIIIRGKHYLCDSLNNIEEIE